ncbi:hypothetical protein V6N12_031553 [Hibiscus sabdariffa]|uniref:RNase H type-1 domain-containing protein n=1 Tax=Hibiscus sabdariffa TaxID=183260 RepID=A0ABR2CPL0_9ROSI
MLNVGLSDGICQIYEMDVETITHVFPDCAKEKEIHSIGDIPPRLETAQLNRDGKRAGIAADVIKDWILEAKSVSDSLGFNSFITLLWGIWNSRNSTIFDNETAPHVPQQRRPKYYMLSSAWPMGFSEITGQGAVGFIARDWNGEVLAGGAKMVHDPCSPNLAKAEAFMAGVALAVGKRCTRVVFEGDAIEIVNRLGNPILDLSTLGTQLEPIREATKDFISRSFTNVNRISNRVAHELVQWALGNSCDTSFNYDYPNFI